MAKEVDNWDWKHDHNEERDIEWTSSHHLKFSNRLLFVRLRTATLGSRRHNRFVLCNTNYARNRLIDNVDDRVFNDRRLLSWRLPRCHFCNGLPWPLVRCSALCRFLARRLVAWLPTF